MVGIGFSDLSLDIDFVDREVTGSVEVKIGIECASEESVDRRGVLLWDVAIPHGFADDRAIFALSECVVVGLARRDLVNSTRSFSSSAAVLWLTYSEPESEWKPRIAKGKPSRSRLITGNRKASLMCSTDATNSHWVTISTALIW